MSPQEKATPHGTDVPYHEMVSEANESSPFRLRTRMSAVERGGEGVEQERAGNREIDQHGAEGSREAADREAARAGETCGVQDPRDQQDEAAHMDVPGRQAEQGKACDAGHQHGYVL